jgi:hypothetical protein
LPPVSRLHARLPFLGLVLSFRKLGDVVASVLKGDKLATARQLYWIIKPSFPAAISLHVAA